jgi:hypothetical protein
LSIARIATSAADIRHRLSTPGLINKKAIEYDADVRTITDLCDSAPVADLLVADQGLDLYEKQGTYAVANNMTAQLRPSTVTETALANVLIPAIFALLSVL